MLTQLTPDQEAKLDVWRDKWIEIGLNTDPANREEAEKWIHEAYVKAGLEEPKEIHWTQSPPAALLKYARINGDLAEDAPDPKPEDLPDGVKSQIYNFCYGSHDACWLSSYDYLIEVCELQNECEDILKLVPLINLAKHCGWWLPYENITIACEKPQEIHLKDGVLHQDGAPAVLYRDGFSVYALNGVLVPEEIAMTDWDKLDAKLVQTTTNAEVRREIVRKIGIEKVCEDLGSSILDEKGDYQLIELDLGDGRRRPWLKMLNPSIGVYHIEGVAPECQTVDQALEWRNGTPEAPTVLT
jgi:hypothetical protein